MPLEMRQQCERCGTPLVPDGTAFVCAFECTFCAACTSAMQGVCPNCDGELVRRPRRGGARRAAGEPALAPPDAMVVDGVPPIPLSVADAVRRHADFRGTTFLAWHPSRREMLVTTRFGQTQQLHWIASPGAARTQLTFFDDPVTVATLPPGSDGAIVFGRDRHGDEFTQLHRLDLATRATMQLTPGGRSQNDLGPSAHRAPWVAYSSTQRNAVDRDVWIVDPSDPGTARCVMENAGGGWFVADVSPDDRTLLVREYVSVTVNALWTVDVGSGERRRVSPAGVRAAYDYARFTPDGAALLAATTRDGEFQRLEQLHLASGEWTALSAHVDADVEGIALSDDGALTAYVTNEAGVSVLRVRRGDEEHVVPGLPPGVLTGLAWRPGAHECACTVSHAGAPADVYGYDADARIVTRWTESEVGGHPRPALPRAELIRWRSFDDRAITGFLYRPAGAPAGVRRPVLIWIHGGPESQIRPEFRGAANAYVNELGAVVIYPNVRGSTGFGRTFVALDDGVLREDSVRDVGALLDWIAQQPDLDPDRVMIAGRSYGGYMTLASAVHFGDRVRCFAEAVGISNFVTFLENTEAYRRDLRRVEYGDERDPAMRAFLTSISPLTHVDRMTRPMLIAQGKNDPRVPATESEQMVAALRARGTPVWFLLATDEGHGFHKKVNDDFLTCAILAFARTHLL